MLVGEILLIIWFGFINDDSSFFKTFCGLCSVLLKGGAWNSAFCVVTIFGRKDEPSFASRWNSDMLESLLTNCPHPELDDIELVSLLDAEWFPLIGLFRLVELSIYGEFSEDVLGVTFFRFDSFEFFDDINTRPEPLRLPSEDDEFPLWRSLLLKIRGIFTLNCQWRCCVFYYVDNQKCCKPQYTSLIKKTTTLF